MRTLNVRIDSRTAAALKTLRESGENISQIVRETLIDRAGKRRTGKLKSTEVIAHLDAIYAKHRGPTPEYIKLGIDTTNREQMSAYIRKQIVRKRRKKS